MKWARILGAVVGGLLLVAGVFFGWASWRSSSAQARTIECHEVDFPIPFPLSPEEREALPEGADPDAIAMERAVARGEHLIRARYGCVECHAADLGGGVMVEDPVLGAFRASNLTGGNGSAVADYEPADWDRAIRHGLRTDGSPSFMPSVDFFEMSDRELSDIVAYVRSRPAVDRTIAERVRLGPLGTVLVATGALPFSADLRQHGDAHRREPPTMAATVEFGSHLAQTCRGCHGTNLAGGPVKGGDPSWPSAANLTPHPDGLAGWTLADFTAALREARSKDGRPLRPPMNLFKPYAEKMTDVEIEALYRYVQSVPALPDP